MKKMTTVRVKITYTNGRKTAFFGGLRVKMAVVLTALSMGENKLISKQPGKVEYDVTFRDGEIDYGYVRFYHALTADSITQPNLFSDEEELYINWPDSNGMIPA
jgi:hypothetical protein